MKVSQIGLLSQKLKNLDDLFTVQDMLMRTGQIEQFSSGVYAYGHIPYLVKKNIENIISAIFTKYEYSELSLPILQPENIWQESGRLEKYVSEEVMFRCLTDKGNFCLAPTAEEAIVTYAKKRLVSYNQLPVTYFQIGQKFRNEIRTRGYLLRGKSFDMLDAYSFGKNQEDLEKVYKDMKRAYAEIFERLGLQIHVVGADSGSIGGNKSEEYMCLSNFGEDTILFDEKSGKAFNIELLEREDSKEYLKGTYGIENVENLQSKKAIELGHIFQLGDKYSQAMNAKYIDENGKAQYYIMGCYGIGVSRTLAMVYEKSLISKENNEFNGIALPINLAPYCLYMIPKLDDNEKTAKSLEIYNLLLKNGVSVLYDDRIEMSIGAKIKDSKVTGTPYFAVLGKTLDEGYIEIENARTEEKIRLSIDNIASIFVELQNNKENGISLEELLKRNIKKSM